MPATPERPNLVFILPDRQRRDTMACYGNDWIQVPHLNGLAEESLVFDNCYVTQAVCCPSRASILCGQYPIDAGMPVNRHILSPDVPTIAEMLGDDYHTGYVGKWHLGDEVVPQHGFQEWFPCFDHWWNEYTKQEHKQILSPYHQWLVANGFEPDASHPSGKYFSERFRSELPLEYHMASWIGETAAGFIERNAEEPFVLYVSSKEPHPPFTSPFNDLYDPATLPVDETFRRYPEGHSLFNRIRAEFWMQAVHSGDPHHGLRDDRPGFDMRTDEGARQMRSNYYGCISLVDRMVGRILGAIDDKGLRDNTIVVFTSDHGEMVGTHGHVEMRSPYEESSRVPLLIRAPWLSQGKRRVEGNFSQIDFVPTLLELLGEQVPQTLPGSSRADVLRGASDLSGNDVFIQHNGIGDRDLTSAASEHNMTPERVDQLNMMKTAPWRSVVTADRWKLTLCASDQGELFDLNTDPSEINNLFDQPEHYDRVRWMAARLRLWQQEVGDTAPLPGV
ncbi:MAG: sulfatase-like hydrolase/transferase [Gemmatimonadetes bacterium]|jgi:arylsulfatase A-like enzyme|nr:sulfatase-like hydrolase/transferase [Gemmatimonadota bacterium]MBT6149132.1 sulfatase-like hydrolase/transferase [Gemmatimonadota bacterium]MBT7863991.1 sulfatase-like hydrolase/transferase [Gemmatimonadota bacterium]